MSRATPCRILPRAESRPRPRSGGAAHLFPASFLLALVASLAAAAPGEAQAQERDETSRSEDQRDETSREASSRAANTLVGIRIVPQVGVHAPLSALGEVREEDEVLLEAERRSPTLSVGLALEVGGDRDRTALRGEVAYSAPADVPVSGTECDGCTIRGSIVTATVGAALRPSAEVGGVHPHLIVGGGLKRYGFDARGVDTESWRALFRDQTRFTWQVGMGAERSVRGVPVRTELTGFFGRYRSDEEWAEGVDDSHLRADVFLSFSIPMGTT